MKMNSPQSVIAILVMSVIVIASTGCGSSRAAQRSDPRGYQETETGTACWYHLPGNTTASGEPYSAKKLTAAHRTLPFGAIVDIRRLDNGREVRVRINDRGPFVKGRIIDLNRAAARKLDLIEKGLAPVEVRVVKVSG